MSAPTKFEEGDLVALIQFDVIAHSPRGEWLWVNGKPMHSKALVNWQGDFHDTEHAARVGLSGPGDGRRG